MGRNRFTEEQVIELRANLYTASVTYDQISFTKTFKERFCELRASGMGLKDTIRELGYDPDVLGEKRLSGISYQMNKAARTGDFRDGRTRRPNVLDLDDPEFTKENFIAMQHEVQYMRKELDFLKKISFIKNTEK